MLGMGWDFVSGDCGIVCAQREVNVIGKVEVIVVSLGCGAGGRGVEEECEEGERDEEGGCGAGERHRAAWQVKVAG